MKFVNHKIFLRFIRVEFLDELTVHETCIRYLQQFLSETKILGSGSALQSQDNCNYQYQYVEGFITTTK